MDDRLTEQMLKEAVEKCKKNYIQRQKQPDRLYVDINGKRYIDLKEWKVMSDEVDNDKCIR